MEVEQGGAGDDGRSNPPTASRPLPPPPVLLVDGHDMLEGDGFMDDMTGRMDELSTSEEVQGDGEREHYSPSSDNFERIIGAIEEIVVGEEFQALQNYFLSTYWTKFAEQEAQDSEHLNTSEEERHEHFKIFQTYSQEMAHLLESQLKKSFRDEHFDFNQFVEDFAERVESAEGRDTNPLFESEIFEMLFTLTDFVKFKELFTDYKEMMEGKTPNLATGITLKPVPSPRH